MNSRLQNKKALLLVNPNARKGGIDLTPVRNRFNSAGFVLVDAGPVKDQTLSEIIRDYASIVEFVIVGGGDGSINEAAPGLLEAKLPSAVLPLGTANDFAQTMEIPLDIEAATEIILRGRTVGVDLGLANGVPFFNVASIGFSADLAKALTPDLKKLRGKLAYGVAAGRLLRTSRLFSVTSNTMVRSRNLKRFRFRSAMAASMVVG